MVSLPHDIVAHNIVAHDIRNAPQRSPQLVSRLISSCARSVHPHVDIPTSQQASSATCDALGCAVIDCARFTVAHIRHSAGSHGIHVPLLSLLVETCLRECASDLISCEDTWFAARRDLVNGHNLFFQYDVATLLALLPLPYPIAARVSDVEEHGTEKAEVPPSSSGDAKDKPQRVNAAAAKLQRVIQHSSSRSSDYLDYRLADPAPVNVSLQRHMLAGGVRESSLCVFVVASTRSIYSAITSALYHRLAWNVRDPVVGLAYPETGRKAWLIIGWLEDVSRSYNSELPRAHVCHAPFQDSCANTESGVFDLHNLSDALVLARLVTSLKDHLQQDRVTACFVADDDLPSWRADQEETRRADLEETERLLRRLSIESWCRGVDASDGWQSQAVNTSDAAYCEGSNALPGSPVFLYPHESSTICKPAVYVDALTPTTPLLCPQRLPVRNFLLMQKCLYWFLDRYTFYHAFPPIAFNYRGDFNEYRHTKPTSLALNVPFYNTYHAMTALSWPSGWRSSDRLPRVPALVLNLGSELFRMAMESNMVGQENDIVTLTLEHNLAQILLLCAFARASDRRPASHQLAGSHGRYFEALTHLLLSDASSTLRLRSGGVALRLPRSDYLDRLTRVGFQVAELTFLSVRVVHGMRWHQESDMLTASVQAFSKPLNRVTADNLLGTLGWQPKPMPTLIRSLECPSVGLCDALVSFEIPLPTSGDASQKFECSDLVANDGDHRDYRGLFSPHWEEQPAVQNAIASTSHTNYPLNAAGEPVATVPGIPDASGPAQLSHACYSGAPEPEAPGLQKSGQTKCLNLPVLITVDGTDPIRGESTPEQAIKLRMALTAAVKFLAALDIVEFPVFGLFINGSRAIATMAWGTRLSPSILHVDTEDTRRGLTEVHVLENGCTSFDIDQPCGIYNLSTFLLRLRFQHLPRLAALVQEALKDDERRQCVASARWTTADQTSDAINLQAAWSEDEDSLDSVSVSHSSDSVQGFQEVYAESEYSDSS